MGYKITRHVADCLQTDAAARALKTSERCVWLILANFAHNDTGHAYPAQTLVAELAGMSERHVRRCYQSLASTGLVDLVERPGRTTLVVIHTPDTQVLGSSEAPRTSATQPRTPRSYPKDTQVLRTGKQQDIEQNDGCTICDQTGWVEVVDESRRSGVGMKRCECSRLRAVV